jgi:hypothetical protein
MPNQVVDTVSGARLDTARVDDTLHGMQSLVAGFTHKRREITDVLVPVAELDDAGLARRCRPARCESSLDAIALGNQIIDLGGVSLGHGRARLIELVPEGTKLSVDFRFAVKQLAASCC